jgi:5-methyltetrahydropteroyltriglutamate--homocysteine methyltransferase
MTSDRDRIHTTHVGSLVRPPKLVDFIRLIEQRAPYDRAAYDACLADCVREVVRQQVEAGIDIVSDGEFGKGGNWARYVHRRLTGIVSRTLTPEEKKDPVLDPDGGRDREVFRDFYAEQDQEPGVGGRTASRIICNGPITYTGQSELQRDIDNLKAATAQAAVEGAFLPVVAPASALPRAKNEYYPDERTFIFSLAEALRQEYRTIADAGLIVQIDDASFPHMYEKLVPPLTLAQYKEWAQLRIDALNHALEGIPEERTRYHVCWGSWNGPHVFDVPMSEIIDLVLQVRVGAYSFEAANPRHEHEWRLWETVKLPPGKILIPGVISHATNVVEHPELVAQRIVRLAKIVGREFVMGGTDCGFAQTPFIRRVHPSIMWAKLKSLAEGARLATLELWGRQSAA